MGSTRFRNPRALSSALASLGTLQPRALGFLNRVDPMDSMSNLYIASQIDDVIAISACREIPNAFASVFSDSCKCVFMTNQVTDPALV